MKTKSVPVLTQEDFMRRHRRQKKWVIFYRILILVLFLPFGKLLPAFPSLTRLFSAAHCALYLPLPSSFPAGKFLCILELRLFRNLYQLFPWYWFLGLRPQRSFYGGSGAFPRS